MNGSLKNRNIDYNTIWKTQPEEKYHSSIRTMKIDENLFCKIEIVDTDNHDLRNEVLRRTPPLITNIKERDIF